MTSSAPAASGAELTVNTAYRRPPTVTRLANLRDLGGLPLVSEGTTRSGVLYRSDAPYAGDEPPKELTWPPAVVIDLRADSEVGLDANDWTAATRVVSHPLFDQAHLGNLTRGADLISVYEGMLTDSARRIAQVVDLAVDATGPVLVHCAAGKDRTGVVVAALLLLAGVSPDAVAADYRLTGDAMPKVLERLFAVGAATRSQVEHSWVAAPEEGVQMVVNLLTGHPGGPRQWFLDHGASEDAVDAWCTRIRG